MGAFTVDRDKCNICGMCVLECPTSIIWLTEPGPYPSWIEGGEGLCINCGHCVAVCPLGAVELDSMKLDACPVIRRGVLPSAEQVELLIKSRRSIRAYKDERVPGATLEKLIDIARYGPTGSNTQSVQWMVVEDPKEVRRLAGLIVDWMRTWVQAMAGMAESVHLERLIAECEAGEDRVLRGAPHLIVVHAPQEDPMAPASGTIALTTLELAAYSMGLGACWAGYFNMAAQLYKPMKDALQLPEGHVVLGGMMIGYPKYKFTRIPVRNEPNVIWR